MSETPPATAAPAIYVDLDDVLADTTQRIVAQLNARFARQVSFEDLRCFDLVEAFAIDPSRRDEVMAAVHEPDFLRAIPAREGAHRVLRAWDDAGVHVAVVTGRPPSVRALSEAWLRDRALPHGAVHCIDKYGRYAGHDGCIALDTLRPAQFRAAIEDSLEMACYLAARGTERVLLMDRPWNRAVPSLPAAVHARIERVTTWNEIWDALGPSLTP
jgi:uncharacterized HAD superfamily protein